MDLPDRNQASSWEGMRVVDRDGEPLGTCLGVFADTETGVTEWLDIDVQGRSRSFVPALDAVEADGAVRVAFSRAAVLDAPAVGDQEQLSKRDETELYRHYGVPVESGGSVLPADAPAGAGQAAGLATAAAGTSAATSDVDAGPVDPALADTTPETASSVPAGGDAPAEGGVDASGLDLPVLDPAVASVPVPEGTEVPGETEPDTATEADTRTEPEPAAPRLRRVTAPSSPEPAPSPTPWPPPASADSSGGLSAGAPLAGVAGLAAAVFLVLRAREQRRQRRSSPTAKADRLRRQVAVGTTLAKASASRSLSSTRSSAATTGRQVAAGASVAAKQLKEGQAAAVTTGRQLSVAAAAAAHQAAERQRKAAARTAKQASKESARRKRRLAATLASAGTAAQRSGSAASSAVSAVPSAVGSSLEQASRNVSRRKRAAERRQRVAETKRAAERRRKAAAKSVSTAPRKAAKKGRGVRRSLARKAWELVLATAAGGGYVLGAKAGRERYDELTDVASAVAASPQVQSLTESVTDPSRRAALLDAVARRSGRAGRH